MTINGAVIASSLNILLWILRLRLYNGGVLADAKWIFLFALWAERGLLWISVVASSGLLHDLTPLWAYAAATILSISGACIIYKSLRSQVILHQEPSAGRRSWGDDFLKPLIFPSRTSHTRLFPKKHSFSLSYLLVGVPVGWKGSVGSFLSVDEDETEASRTTSWLGAWFSVKAADYLHRGQDTRGLKGKLESFLESQVRSL